jgi:hypothetical protein
MISQVTIVTLRQQMIKLRAGQRQPLLRQSRDVVSAARA